MLRNPFYRIPLKVYTAYRERLASLYGVENTFMPIFIKSCFKKDFSNKTLGISEISSENFYCFIVNNMVFFGTDRLGEVQTNQLIL